MEKHNIIIILAVVLIILSSNASYAIEEKSILILVDELDLKTVGTITDEINFGIGYINLKTRKPIGVESYYFSIAGGRKVGVKSEDYKGLYKDENGIIIVSGFQDMYKDITKGTRNIKINTLGEKLKKEGISYIGDNSSAVIAANNNGSISSGEIEVIYNKKWLIDKTDLHLSKSNVLVLSYDINNTNQRAKLLEDYIKEYENCNIIIIPNRVSENMRYIINNSIAPVIYVKGDDNGIIKALLPKGRVL